MKGTVCLPPCRSADLRVYPPSCLHAYLLKCLRVYLPTCLPIPTYVPTGLPAYVLPVYLPACLSAYVLPAYLPTCLPAWLLSVSLLLCLCTCLVSTYLSNHLSVPICLPVCLPATLFVCLPVCLLVYLCSCPPQYLPVGLSVLCPSVRLSACLLVQQSIFHYVRLSVFSSSEHYGSNVAKNPSFDPKVVYDFAFPPNPPLFLSGVLTISQLSSFE